MPATHPRMLGHTSHGCSCFSNPEGRAHPAPIASVHEDDTLKSRALATAEALERAGRNQALHPWTPQRALLRAGHHSVLWTGERGLGPQGWRLTWPLVPVGLIRMCSKFFSPESSSNCLQNGFREADLLNRYAGSADISPVKFPRQTSKRVFSLVQC